MTSPDVRDPAELAPRKAWKPDLVSGFLVFLIALPLCLGISMASGFPPFSGVLTAIVGGIATSLLGGAPLTIKGPAAGLIVIVLGAVEEMGKGDAMRGYRLALAVVVVSGVVQIGLGLLKAGKFGDFFPSSAVHGLLAAIGIIIVSKQVHVALGVTPTAKEPLGLLLEIPHSIGQANPAIVLIGGLSLLILFGWPLLRKTPLRHFPAPLAVLLVAIPLGYVLDLNDEHKVHWGAMMFDIGPKFLVRVPERLLDVVTFPDFSAAVTGTFWKHVVLFTMVGTLESLLSAKAVDTLDPYARKTDLNKDIVALGIGNALAGALGGLPMISEIVRSSANVQNGGRTRLANLFHGLFLLLFVALLPGLVHRIPLAALAALLIYTGARLASPKEFMHAAKIGREQLAIFSTTVVVTLLTDLLIGIAAGIALKFALHLWRGVEAKRMLATEVRLSEEDGATVVHIGHAAVFSNYLGIKRYLAAIPADRKVIIDLSATLLVDHTVMHHFKTEQTARRRTGGDLVMRGLGEHQPVSSHPLAARLRRKIEKGGMVGDAG